MQEKSWYKYWYKEMDNPLPDFQTIPCGTVLKTPPIITGLIKIKNKVDTKSDFEFIAKPLQVSSCEYTLGKTVAGENNFTEEKDIVCTYMSTDDGDVIISPAELGFGITEEIVESDVCDDSIIIDKIGYTSPVQATDSLSLGSILDQIPQGNELVDGNVNIELYLECSEDSENSHDQVKSLKSNVMTAEATSQIKMDTQFKVSFPLIPERGLKCSLCKLFFLSKDFLREHTISKHSADFLFCNLCPYFTKSKKFFNTHLQTRHLHLSFSADSTSALLSEPRIVPMTDKETASLGKEADVSHSHFDGNESGRADVESNKPESLSNKSEKHNVRSNQRNIVAQNTHEHAVSCEQCEFRTKSNRLLNYHKQTMHNQRRQIFQCPDCAYTCVQRRSFESHKRRHTGAFDFQCKICEKKFVSKHLLTKHSKKHCEKSVGYLNGTSSVNEYCNLRVHVSDEKQLCSTSTQTNLVKKYSVHGKHSGIRNLSIKKNGSDSSVKSCGTSFLQIANSKKFQCTFDGCKKICRDSFNLRNHLAVHTKSKSIKCNFCEFKCIQINSLNHHVKTKHK